MARLLYVTSRSASFIRLDAELLSERHELAELHGARNVLDPLAVARAVRRAELVVGWWAWWHTALPVADARLLRRPCLLIVGGFDTASEPRIGYGLQRGGPRRWLSRAVMRGASALVTNSEYSREEIARTVGPLAARVDVVHHGIPDRFGEPRTPPAGRPLVLSVGVVDAVNLLRKGHGPMADAAARVSEADWILAGAIEADATGEELRGRSAGRLGLPGWLETTTLDALYRRAAVYVQPSVHEGFGFAVAEAMLAGCVPVITRAGALPEVVGGTGVLLDDARPETVAAGVRRALGLAAQGAGAGARARVLQRFPVSGRRDGLLAAVDRLLAGGRGGRGG